MGSQLSGEPGEEAGSRGIAGKVQPRRQKEGTEVRRSEGARTAGEPGTEAGGQGKVPARGSGGKRPDAPVPPHHPHVGLELQVPQLPVGARILTPAAARLGVSSWELAQSLALGVRAGLGAASCLSVTGWL